MSMLSRWKPVQQQAQLAPVVSSHFFRHTLTRKNWISFGLQLLQMSGFGVFLTSQELLSDSYWSADQASTVIISCCHRQTDQIAKGISKVHHGFFWGHFAFIDNIQLSVNRNPQGFSLDLRRFDILEKELVWSVKKKLVQTHLKGWIVQIGITEHSLSVISKTFVVSLRVSCAVERTNKHFILSIKAPEGHQFSHPFIMKSC